MRIPLSRPDITDFEIDAVTAVLRGDQLSLGPRLLEFEDLVAARAGCPCAIAVSSGTAGLHLAIRALGIGPGDEVLVPSFTFIAAANVIRYEGAAPVFVDIDPATLNLDPASVERAITQRTRAIMAVHTFGLPAPVRALRRIARLHNLRLIEDACEALGAEHDGQPAGSFGDLAVFAFYPNKQITTGEGGIVVTHDAALAREVRALRNHGRYPSDAWHQHSILGFNYRLSEINCALGAAQMQRLDEILARREQAAALYRHYLAPIEGITLPPEPPPGDRISWFVYVVRLDASPSRVDVPDGSPPHPSTGETLLRDPGEALLGDPGEALPGDPGEALLRDRVLGRLGCVGIQCGRYFAPIHQQPAYAGWPLRHPLPVTERESRRTLALPFFTSLSAEEIAEVATRLGEAIAFCSP